MLKENKKLSLVLTQIIILVLGTIAISYAIGSEMKIVSAVNTVTTDEGKTIDAETTSKTPNPIKVGFLTKLKNSANPFGKIGTPTQEFTKMTIWASVLYIGGKQTSKLFGASSTEANAIGKGLGSAYIGARLTYIFMLKVLKIPAAIANPIGFIIFGGLFLFTFLSTKDYKQETVVFQCLPWQPQSGGSDCDKCNQQGILPCSEYQCNSLGRSCKIANKGTKEEACVFSRANDVNPPIITPVNSFLSDGFEFVKDESVKYPDSGVKIQGTGTSKCVKAFNSLTFGFTTDERAHCKIDNVRKSSYSDMRWLFGENSYDLINHTQSLSGIPSKEALEEINLTLQNGGNFALYVRCEDRKGNKNLGDFVFKYCVENGPDTEQPAILGTSILNGAPIGYNQTSANVDFYINKPADCRWTHDSDKSFSDMEETMSCPGSILEVNVQNIYPCKTTLTGVKDNQENKFYVRCQDRSTNKNTMQKGYEYILIGTKPLVISDVAPNETVRDSTEAVKVTLEVETTAGYKDGEAICYFSETENEKDYNQFYPETGGNTHSQDLYLGEGTYKYYFKCVDAGGNIDRSFTEFSVESDNEAPLVVRAYHEDGELILITNEAGKCVYSTNDCVYIFEDGESISSFEEKEYSVEWDSKRTYYIKCEDDYNNQPVPDQCSIVVRPLN